MKNLEYLSESFKKFSSNIKYFILDLSDNNLGENK